MNTVVASGLALYTYEDTVEAIINTEGRRYPLPAGMDYEDLAQEIRLECYRVMKSYDSSRIGPSPYRFLQVCVRNFLFNMRRGIYVPNNPPCVRCPLWDKINKRCEINEVGCEEIIKYREGMAKRAAIKKPDTLEEEVIDSGIDQDVDKIILHESIKSILPSNLLPIYEKMINGEGNKVSARNKKIVRDLIKEMLDNA